ncbi:MAG: PAAR domain-containing protein, partial [Rhodospirillaceae bacterium]
LYMLKYSENPMYQPLKLWHFSTDGYEFGRVVQRDPGAKAQRDAVLQSYYDLGKLVNGFPPGAVADSVDLQLTFPNGASPKVFTAGWTFGAKAILNPGTKGEKDVSAQVRWSGSGVFTPAVGAVSHPVFAREGANAIELTVTVNKQKYSAKFTVEAVRANHVTIGSWVACSADTHGCLACPHAVVGQIATGNPKVRINGRPVACVGDTGQHAPCCGPNTFKIVSGDPQVLVDGKPVARVGDQTQHCGGIGRVTSAFAGEAPKAGEPGRK